jgi:small-conductance mechanosensitive channel
MESTGDRKYAAGEKKNLHSENRGCRGKPPTLDHRQTKECETMKNKVFFAILMLLAGFAFAAYAGQQESHSKQVVLSQSGNKDQGESSGTATGNTQEQIQEYKQKMRKELDVLKGKIDELGAKAEKLKADAKDNLNKQVAVLRQKWTETNRKLEELKGSASTAWEDVKAQFDSAMKDLKQAYDRAASK